MTINSMTIKNIKERLSNIASEDKLDAIDLLFCIDGKIDGEIKKITYFVDSKMFSEPLPEITDNSKIYLMPHHDKSIMIIFE